VVTWRENHKGFDGPCFFGNGEDEPGLTPEVISSVQEKDE